MSAALVTGGGRRIGSALALALGDLGLHVLVHYFQSRGGANETVAAIRKKGGKADLIRADLSDLAEVVALVPRALQLAEPISVLVNSASLFERDELHDLEGPRFDRQIAVNLRAPAFLAKAFADALPKSETGVIVNVADTKVVNPDPVFLSYGLSKIALDGLTSMLALALAPRIRVNTLAPGMTLQSGAQTQKGFEAARRKTPLERSSELADLQQALIYLVQAKAVTGYRLVVDGGAHLQGPLGSGRQRVRP